MINIQLQWLSTLKTLTLKVSTGEYNFEKVSTISDSKRILDEDMILV